MIEKLLWQMMDVARLLSLSVDEAFPLALTILAWAKLSQGDELPSDLRLSQRFVREPGSAISVAQQVAALGGQKQQAFAAFDRLAKRDIAQFGDVFKLALQFQAQGLLDHIDAADAYCVLDDTKLGGNAIPAEIAEILVRLGAPVEGESAYVMWDRGGQIASRLAAMGADAYLESPEMSPTPALVSLLSPRPFSVSYADPIRSPSAVEGGKLKVFDVAVSVPPFGIRYGNFDAERDLFGRFPERTPLGNVLAIRHLLAQARRRIVVSTQNNLLFGVGAERQLREDLLRKGQIEAVVSLPQGLLRSTNIGFTILVIDPRGGHERVRFVDADHERFRAATSKARCRLSDVDTLLQEITCSDESEHAVTVATGSILDNEAQLQVGRYVVPASRKRAFDLLARSTTKTLGTLVQSIRPLASSPEADHGVEAFEVGAQDLPEYGYIVDPGRSVRIEQALAEKAADQFLRARDIVLIIKGSVGKVGIVSDQAPPPGPGGWVAGQSSIVLRCQPGSKVDPRVLALQLRSPLGQELLSSIVSGATIPMIQLRELMKLQVMVPSLLESQEAAEALDREASLQNDIARIRNELAGVSAKLWALQ